MTKSMIFLPVMLPLVNLAKERITQTKQREDKHLMQHMASLPQTYACTSLQTGGGLTLPPATNFILLFKQGNTILLMSP